MNFVNAVHPDNKPYFRAIATPTKDIRAGRSNMSVSCSQCTTANEMANLQRCAKVCIPLLLWKREENSNAYTFQCKSAWYCSKEARTAIFLKYPITDLFSASSAKKSTGEYGMEVPRYHGFIIPSTPGPCIKLDAGKHPPTFRR